MNSKSFVGYLACAYVAYIVYKNSTKDLVYSRKKSQGLTTNSIDKQLQTLNRAHDVNHIPNNIDLPYYSRYNYDRRRRPKYSTFF